MNVSGEGGVLIQKCNADLQGTTYVYSTLLRPFVVQYESEIDHNLNEVRTRAGDIALLWWQKGSMYAQARFYELLQFLASQSNKVQQNPSGAPSRTPAQGLSRGLPQVHFLRSICVISIWVY